MSLAVLASGHGYADVVLFRWLRGHLHWWALPVFTAWTALTVFWAQRFGSKD